MKPQYAYNNRFFTDLIKTNKPSEVIRKCEQKFYYKKFCLSDEFWIEYVRERFGTNLTPRIIDLLKIKKPEEIALHIEEILNQLFASEIYPSASALFELINTTDEQLRKIIGNSCCTILSHVYLCIFEQCECEKCEEREDTLRKFIPKGPLYLKIGTPYNRLSEGQKIVINRIINFTRKEEGEEYITPAGTFVSPFSIDYSQELLDLLPEIGYIPEDRASIADIIIEREIFPLYDKLQAEAEKQPW